jgi:hypothetical protein
MKKERHLLTDIDTVELTGICAIDGSVSIYPTGKFKPDGSIYWRCHPQKNRITAENKRPYIVYKKDSCELCGFMPEVSYQLDVDHIDGNNNNNSLDNLQTLCANCHRLKTYQNKDWTRNGLPDIAD